MNSARLCYNRATIRSAWGEQRMQPTKDERLLAALSHAVIAANIVNMVGMIVTVSIWTMQRERSRYVSAHALQSLLYQGAALLIGTLLFLCWGVCLAFSLLPAQLRPELYRTSPPSSLWLALLGLLVPVGFVALTILYGFYAALQVYRGRPFRYPLIERLMPRELKLAIAPSPAPPADAPAPTPLAPGEQPD